MLKFDGIHTKLVVKFNPTTHKMYCQEVSFSKPKGYDIPLLAKVSINLHQFLVLDHLMMLSWTGQAIT